MFRSFFFQLKAMVFQVNREKELLKSKNFPRNQLLKILNDFMLNLLFPESNKLAQDVHEVISQCIMGIIVPKTVIGKVENILKTNYIPRPCRELFWLQQRQCG